MTGRTLTLPVVIKADIVSVGSEAGRVTLSYALDRVAIVTHPDGGEKVSDYKTVRVEDFLAFALAVDAVHRVETR